MKVCIIMIMCVLFVPPGRTDFVTWGRQHGRGWEVHAGFGTVDKLDGGVRETINGERFEDGIFLDLRELGVKDSPEVWQLGAAWNGKWLSVLLDYRYASISGSGTAEQDYRFRVSSIEFLGQRLDYLLLPSGTDFRFETETTWLGGGLRFTPVTLNADGLLSFTPWIHLGIQMIDFTYTVRAGGTAGIEREGTTNRLFSIQGSGTRSETAAIPEYGFGAQLRFHPRPEEKGFQVVAEAGYRLLDFQGAISRLGLDGDDFRDVDFTYTALDLQLYAQIPVADRFDVLVGLFLQQVNVDYRMDGGEARDGLRRNIDFDYTLYGLRLGVLF